MARYKYLDTLVLIFVVVLLVSNLVAQKVCRLGPFTISGAELLFPITYIFGDVFTEVYGYQASRRAIWIGFFASALLSAAGAMAVALPADPGWHNQQAFETVFGVVPRFVAASLIAYWTGEFANSFTLAKLKVLTDGRWLWTRTIGSTIVGQAFDTFLVMFISFAGTVSRPTLIRLMRLVVPDQGGLRDAGDTAHLCRGRLAQTPGGRGCLRYPHRLQSLLAARAFPPRTR